MTQPSWLAPSLPLCYSQEPVHKESFLVAFISYSPAAVTVPYHSLLPEVHHRASAIRGTFHIHLGSGSARHSCYFQGHQKLQSQGRKFSQPCSELKPHSVQRATQVALRSLLHIGKRPHIQMKPKQDQGSSQTHPFLWRHQGALILLLDGGEGQASVVSSMSMVMAVVMTMLVEMMGRMAVLAVLVVNTYTGHPGHSATVMVMANDSRETQAPAMEESRPGL